jgi:isopenicillin N synthase-like dioxygenase
MTAGMVPVIALDVGEEDEGRLAREVDGACRGAGFFYVSGHGVEEALLRSALAMSERLFALPEEVKRRALGQTAANRGWTP